MFSLGLRSQRIVNEELNASGRFKGASRVRKFSSGADRAVVTKSICPGCPGRVRYQATWWPAQCTASVTLNPGDQVRVVGIHNITLIVEPVADAFSNQQSLQAA
ncbi:MAG: NfeD family protein [Leptolyngbyaceae bacterium]|nr:NfeD family protein [Leptolyngbyaceae bacterium]